MKKKCETDPLLGFFLKLMENREEKKVLTLIFEELDDEIIIEKLIDYRN